MVEDMVVPRSIDAVTADWMTRALSSAEADLVVNSVHSVEVIRGASSKVRIALRTNRNDFPTTVIVKAGFEQHSKGMKYMHRNEMHAYRDLVPTLDVNTPHCFFAGIDPDGHSVVVLEDLALRNVHFLHLQRPLSFTLAAAFLDRLARIHARWWGAAELRSEPFEWVPDTSEKGFWRYLGLLRDPASFARYAMAPRGAAMAREMLDPARIAAAFQAMRVHHEGSPLVINHGDMHLGNLYIDERGEPGFLDWQPRLAPWSIDVSYFLAAGLDLVDRRRWEGALLQHYLDRLITYGVAPPGFDDAWDAYRRDVIWGLLIWLLNSSSFQTEANNTAAATRFAMAMIDHRTFDLLEV